MNKERLKIFHSLYPGAKAFKYQTSWASDRSKFKVAVKARQIGITYTEAVDKFLENLLWEPSKESPAPMVTIFCSPSQRQSLRLMQYIHRARGLFERNYETNVSFKKESEAHLVFDNHCEIFSLPNNPRTVEGIDANQCIVDEMGNFGGNEDRDIYNSLMGSLGAKGGGITLFGVPRGRRGLFWEVCDPYGEYSSKFSVHNFPWTVRAEEDEKYRLTVLEHKERMSPTAFGENYECLFSDENVVLFSYALLDKQRRNIEMWSLERNVPNQFPIYMGIDFGKKNNQTAVTILYHADDNTSVRFHAVTNADFNEQIIWLSQLLEHFRPTKCFVDSTGMGLPLLDVLVSKFPGIVEGVTFTAQVKEKMILSTLNILKEGRLILPKDNAYDDLVDQLHGFEKEVMESGKVKYTGKRTETEWLDDRACSLFLACSQLGASDFGFMIADNNKSVPTDPYKEWLKQ